ncbi:type II toxin-antitoxin system RelE/ParE family toxin [Facilibium subflavum]|uniref:type II toxin-antitoxin system RelE/ParE family toxin n=1 Tax=Facilibium subflavum TaxID=2219058 RepID=UPI000E64DE18|nr:type II toxin-antitoxin system RelE/ParE family toxin [Facilibium subflavum]
MRQIRIYQTEDGKAPFTIWLDNIKDKVAKARIRRRIDRLYLGNEGDHKHVGDGVFELRLPFGPGYRIYYAKTSDVIYILLLGGDKKTQSNDIKLARKYWLKLKSGGNNECAKQS